MGNTYTQLNIHVVFTVKGKSNVLTDDFINRLFEYISGILTNLQQYPLAVGGYKDHVHIFFELNPKDSLSNIVHKVKANSARWINENGFVSGFFEWQRGYGAFSYSKSQRNNVIRYIMRQKEHHSAKTFKEEYFEILKQFNIRFEDKYMFDFLE